MFSLPASSQGQRAYWKWAISVATILLTAGFVYYAYDFSFIGADTPSPLQGYSEVVIPAAVPSDMSQLVPYLWKPYLHRINATTFTTKRGLHYEIPDGAQRWTQPLGKKLLILDVDTRPNDGPGGLLNDTKLDLQNVTGRTAGLMNHYMYSLIHGYDYRFIQAPDYPGRHGTWVKVPMIKEALKTHDFVVFMDADAVVEHPHLPLEWLLNLWNVTTETLVAMAEDPNSENNRDSKGWVLWNTGFVIAQQSARTQELFDIWDKCPTGERYPDCKHWAQDWAHEQAAFGNFVRYDFNTTDDIRVISCGDGNGAHYIKDKKCSGTFVSHHWFDKEKPEIAMMYDWIMATFVRRLHDHFHDEREKYFINAHEMTYPLDGLHV